MITAVLVARLALAAVFAVAGFAKIMDLPGSRRAVREFGVPEFFSAPVGTLLPLVELAIAVALLTSGSARWGASAALFLLSVFVVAVTRALARGEEPDCHCFGQLRASPAGWSTLARNLALSAVAGVIVLDGPGTSAVGWLARLGSAEVAALCGGILVLAVIAAQGSFSYQLLRQNGRLIARLDAFEAGLAAPGGQAAGLPIGAAAPGFTLPGPDGEMVSLDALRARGRDVMVVFSHPECGPCEALLPELAGWQQEHQRRLTIVLVSQGDRARNREQLAEYAPRDLLLQPNGEVSDAYRALATPSAQLVTSAGTIASPLAQGAEEIRTLLVRALDQATPKLHITRPSGNRELVARNDAGDSSQNALGLPTTSPRRAVWPGVTPTSPRALPAPAKATLAAGAVAIATQALTGEASAATDVAAIKRILAQAKPAMITDNRRIGEAVKQRASHPKRAPTAAITAIGQERSLLAALQDKVTAVHSTGSAKALTLDALSLGAQTLQELQLTLAATKLVDKQHHAANTRALSKRAQQAFTRADKALG